MRLCTQFYSEEFLLNYIRFQKLSFSIAIDRLKLLLESTAKTTKFDLNNLVKIQSLPYCLCTRFNFFILNRKHLKEFVKIYF